MATIGGVNPTLSNLNRINSSLQQTTQRIATGSNYNSASQGSSAYAILQRMNSHIGAIGQSVQNTQNASAMLKIAAGATGNTISALTEIRRNLVNAANGTNTDSDRAALQQNINQIVSQIDDNARANYNGINLLDGSRDGIMVAGISGYENVEVGDMRSQALGLTDNQGNVTISTANDESIQSALQTVDTALNFVGGVNDSLSAAMDEGTFSLDEALDEATTQGAQLQRLDYQAANYTTMEENEQAAASNIGDTDMARAVVNLNNEEVQRQIAMAISRMYNHNQASVLSLLQ